MDDRVITGHIPGIDDQNINNKVTTNILSQKTNIVSILAIIIIILFIIWPYISAKLDLIRIKKENDYQWSYISAKLNLIKIKKENDYQKALKEYESKNYQQAQNLFNSLNDYKDSIQKSAQCSSEIELLNKEKDYKKALKEYENKNYQQAQSLFLSLKDYKDSFKRSIKCEFMSKVGIEFCLCPAGEFLMGSPANDNEQYSDEPLHKVYISKDFYIGKYPVTQKQYEIIMGTNPSKFKDNKDSDNLPVENVTWKNANEFCIKMTEKYKIIIRTKMPFPKFLLISFFNLTLPMLFYFNTKTYEPEI